MVRDRRARSVGRSVSRSVGRSVGRYEGKDVVRESKTLVSQGDTLIVDFFCLLLLLFPLSPCSSVCLSVWYTHSCIVWVSQTSVNHQIRENIAKAASKWNIDYYIFDQGIMQDKWLAMYQNTKELARKRDQQQQQQQQGDNKVPGEIEKQNVAVNDDDDKEEIKTNSEEEDSQRGDEADDDDDECANFIRGVIGSCPSTEAVRDENHVFTQKKRAKRHKGGTKRPILGTRGRWIKFLGLNDHKMTRTGKFVTTDQLAQQYSGGQVTTRGAARKRKNDAGEEGGEEREQAVGLLLPEKKRKTRRKRKRGRKSNEEEEEEEEKKEEEEEEESSSREASTTEERKGEKRNEEEEVEKRSEKTEEEEAAKGQDRGYKSEEPSSLQTEAPPAVTVEQAREKILKAQENEEHGIDHLPIGSLVSNKGAGVAPGRG